MKKSNLGLAAVAVVLPFLVGCGDKPTGTLSGAVSYKGKPVVSGTVTVYDAQTRAYQGTIADGRYQVANVPEGAVTIIVVSKNPAQTATRPGPADVPGKGGGKDDPKGGGGGPAMTPPPTGWFALPKNYEDASTSPLKTTVKAGENPYDLTLID